MTIFIDAFLTKTSMIDAFTMMFIEGKNIGKYYVLTFTIICLGVGIVSDWKRKKKKKNMQQG
ncbi:hypothetical protein [Metabacillus iocasae]|uniref:Uncharacterized protein n=1 Tax=Priestia iocasae TaxID=2291674 RepID=A0ABS2QRW2_9BACI|nr:hypothetical protein [Metabacillus iocasae]MBM7702179.1 hypothetical protein [Metabacillus iocasae]